MDDAETLHRRARLRELIDHCFGGRLVDFAKYIEQRTNKPTNVGELSALRKDHSGRSFGDKKAKTLVEQIGLHRQWFSMPMGTNVDQDMWLVGPTSGYQVKPSDDRLRLALQDWRLQASPRSRQTIDRLSVLAQKNALQDDDWKLIEQLATRLRHPS